MTCKQSWPFFPVEMSLKLHSLCSQFTLMALFIIGFICTLCSFSYSTFQTAFAIELDFWKCSGNQSSCHYFLGLYKIVYLIYGSFLWIIIFFKKTTQIMLWIFYNVNTSYFTFYSFAFTHTVWIRLNFLLYVYLFILNLSYYI